MPTEPIRRAKRGSIATAVLVRLDADTAERLRAAAEREHVSLTEYVREALSRRLRGAPGY